MTFALHSALKAPLTTAIPFAAAWGIAIMSLDRWLVVSLVRQQNKLNYLVVALPRVALAILFGLVISTPFTLQIFQPEINRQITVIRTQGVNSYDANLKLSSLAKTIRDDQARVARDEKVAGGGAAGSQATDPRLNDLERQRTQDLSQQNHDYASWQCQLGGGQIGGQSCTAGNGRLAKAKENAYPHDVQAVALDDAAIKVLQHNLTTAAAASMANAQRDLGPDRAQLKADQASQRSLKEEFLKANSSDHGLLLQLRALDQVAAGSGTLQAARWLLFLLFSAIECLPVLVKVLLNLGPPTSYEKALAHTEQAGLQLMEEEALRRRQQATMASDARSDELELLNAEWRTKLPAIIQETTAARERIVRSKLARWERVQAASNGEGHMGLGDLLGARHLTGPDWQPQRRPARQEQEHGKDQRQPGPTTSAWPYWPDSL